MPESTIETMPATAYPLIFTSASVRGMQDGSKTNTLRVLRHQPEEGKLFFWSSDEAKQQLGDGWDYAPSGIWHEGKKGLKFLSKCRMPGDLIWVKELWDSIIRDTPERAAARMAKAEQIKTIEDLDAWAEMPTGGGETKYIYAADFGDYAHDPDSEFSWRTPLFMPRVASRLMLRVRSVEIIRLQDIDCDTIILEGIECPVHDFDGGMCHGECAHRRKAFMEHWESINAKKHPWVKNKWCASIRFEVVK
jgi:hypothetical protein